MTCYQSIYDWHQNHEVEDFVLKKLKNGFPRIWQDVQTKVKILVTSSTSIGNLDIDTFLKIIDTIQMLIEIGKKFCGSSSSSLTESLKEQSLNYFQSFHQNRLLELKMHIENEGWQICPVQANFNLENLGKKQKNFDTVQDFVTPFDQFLVEENSEFDGCLTSDHCEDLENCPMITNSSLMLLRLFGKYLHLLQLLEPISLQVFNGLTQLLDFYILAVYNSFTKDLVTTFLHFVLF